jgi:hypothetical protein
MLAKTSLWTWERKARHPDVELESLVGLISSFQNWSHTDKIKFFAWYLHSHRSQSYFVPKDISACFDSLSLAKPSSIGPFLAALVDKKPPQLLKNRSGYRLENRIRATFDQKYGQREATVHVDKLLSELPAKIKIPAEKGYLEETLICFRYKAFRAAVVMCWNLAFDHLCEFVLNEQSRIASFNAQLPKTCPKTEIKVVSNRDHFSELKESQVLQVCKSANIVSGNIYKILKEKLDRRNIAAHPSGIVTSQPTAEEFIKDLVENVVLKLA